ncbi:MAG TPA: hypothetical protein DIU45_13000, partial [Clostridium sp.]|nr:hypothetical protein [Clostridium sp.]
MMKSSHIANNPNPNLNLINNMNTCKSTIKKMDNSDCKTNTESTNVKVTDNDYKTSVIKDFSNTT